MRAKNVSCLSEDESLSVTRPDGVFDYDNYRMSSVTLPAASSGGTRPVVSYSYHSTLGTLQSVTHSANGSLTYGYDAATLFPSRADARLRRGSLQRLLLSPNPFGDFRHCVLNR
jgi:hypothetical protein